MLSVESDKNNIQELNVTPITSQSECSHTPSPSSPEDKSCEHSADEDEREYGKIHIIELHKGNEPLGIHLDDTSPGLYVSMHVSHNYTSEVTNEAHIAQLDKLVSVVFSWLSTYIGLN